MSQGQQQQLTMGRTEWVMLLALSIVFGGAFFFFEIGVQTFEPLTFVWLRVAGAALLLWLYVLWSRRNLPSSAGAWAALLVQGLFNNVVPFGLIAWAQLTIDSSLSSILNATTPLWTVLIVGLVLPDERLTRLKVAGVALGIGGVACMIGVDAIGGLGGSTWVAQLAVVAAAISYGVAGLWGRRFQRWGMDPVVVATGQVTGSSLLLLPVVLFVDPVWLYVGVAGSTAWLSVLGIAVLSTAIAYILFFRIMATAGATNLSLVTFLVPISATVLGVGLLGETIGVSHILGAVMIGVALMLIDGRLLRRRIR